MKKTQQAEKGRADSGGSCGPEIGSRSLWGPAPIQSRKVLSFGPPLSSLGVSGLGRSSLAVNSFKAGTASIQTFLFHSRSGKSEEERASQDVLPGRPDNLRKE